MATLLELLAQRAEIEKRIEQLQSVDRARTIDEVKKVMAEHGLTMADIAGGGGKKAVPPADGTSKKVVAPKYRNAATGETWSGRGLQPRWMKAAIAEGATLESLAI